MSRKMKVENRMYTVVTPEEYHSNSDLYDSMVGTIAVEVEGYVYPLVKKPNEYGYHPKGAIDTFYVPEDIKEEFNAENITDYNKANNIHDYIEMVNQYNAQEYQVLVNPDNIFTPSISRDDEPQMKALKAAILKKNIDLDKYQDRIGPTYQNDKRLFKGKSITFPKLTNIANAIDLKVTLIIEDAGPNVPNPMGEKIVIDITGGGMYDGDK